MQLQVHLPEFINSFDTLGDNVMFRVIRGLLVNNAKHPSAEGNTFWSNVQVQLLPCPVQLSPASLLESRELHVEGDLKPCAIHSFLTVGEPMVVSCESFLLASLGIVVLLSWLGSVQVLYKQVFPNSGPAIHSFLTVG